MTAYQIDRNSKNRQGPDNGYRVVKVSQYSRDAVFFGTKADCAEWIERNGHDEWADGRQPRRPTDKHFANR